MRFEWLSIQAERADFAYSKHLGMRYVDNSIAESSIVGLTSLVVEQYGQRHHRSPKRGVG